MMDEVVLGILMEGPQTGYEIKRTIDLSIGFFYTASFGSLYPALRRLSGQGLLAMNEAGDSKNKKIYTLLPEGRDRFLAWLSEPLSRARNDHMIKIFFYDYLEKEQRLLRLAAFRGQLKAEQGKLGAVKDIVDRETKALEDPQQYACRLSVLTYGIRLLDMVENWIHELEQGNRDEGEKKR